MKQIFRLLVTVIFLIPLTVANSDFSGKAMAQVARAGESIPFESLPVVSKSTNDIYSDPCNSNTNPGRNGSLDAHLLSPRNPGHYSEKLINRGWQLAAHTNNYCAGMASSATVFVHVRLNGAYDSLRGTAYLDDNSSNGANVSVSIIDHNGQQHSVWSYQLGHGGQVAMNVNLHGAAEVILSMSGSMSYPNAINFDGIVDVVASLTRPQRYVIPVYPSQGAVLPADSTVSFVWHGFPGAVGYVLTLWLVKQDGSVQIAPSSRLSFSQLVYGRTSLTWNNRGFLPGSYQYDVYPVDSRGSALAGRFSPIGFGVTR